MTRTSSDSVSRTLRKYSACSEVSALNTPDIFVSPSTIEAILGPKMRSISSTVYSVSSTTSCNKARDDRFYAQADFVDYDFGDSDGMKQIWFARTTSYAFVGFFGKKNARLMKFQSSSLRHILVQDSSKSSHFSLIRASSSAEYPIEIRFNTDLPPISFHPVDRAVRGPIGLVETSSRTDFVLFGMRSNVCVALTKCVLFVV